MTYFNTTNESGATLKNNVAKAKSQEEEILNFFYKHKETINKSIHLTAEQKLNQEMLQPSDLYDNFFGYPITSIRRALTNLTKQGKLIKTNEKRIGMYGRSEYVWKLNENN